MHPDVGTIVWEDGTTPVLVVGHGTDENNIADERLFVVDLGSARALEPDEHGAYNFGAAPYVAGSNNRDINDPQPAGGFGVDTPIAADTSSNAVTSSSDGAPLVPGADGSFVGDPEVREVAGSGDGSGDATYRDNGDGTWTRESDGQRGTFGPSGFTASA